MFLDEKILYVKAGRGGDGAALFRKEKYIPRGGPDGGDGGNGGDVFIFAKSDLHALSHLASIDRVIAEDGDTGGHKQSSGKSGEDNKIEVPLGTMIYSYTLKEDEENNYRVKDEAWQLEKEILVNGDQILVTKGGNGGWGNWHYRSSTNQAPERFNHGLPGERKIIKLILKLIAHIGLVGLPNAGKSTLLSVMTNAHPKIADYPFTTLEPQLGVVTQANRDGRQIVIADLPGLIQDAHLGKGLGTEFLKHIERTRTIVHCIDCSQSLEDMIANYKIIRKELESWSTELSKKPEVVALTKSDCLTKEEIIEKVKQMKKQGNIQYVTPISSIAHEGLTSLFDMVYNLC